MCSCTSILSSAKHGDIDGIEKSLKDGISIETRTQNGSTPLIVAAYSRQAKTVEYLLNNGANVNATDNNHCSALIHAAYYNTPEVVKILIKFDANQTIRDRYGNTAYDYAIEYGHSTISALLDKEAQEIFPIFLSPFSNESETYKQLKMCIFPWKICSMPIPYLSSQNATKKAVKLVIEILKDEKQIILTHCYYKPEIPIVYREIFMNTLLLRGVNKKEIWTTTNPLSKAEPNIKVIIQKGKEIGTDIGLLVQILNQGAVRGVFVYFVDIQKNIITKSEYLVYHHNTEEALKDGMREQLEKFLSATK